MINYNLIGYIIFEREIDKENILIVDGVYLIRDIYYSTLTGVITNHVVY